MLKARHAAMMAASALGVIAAAAFAQDQDRPESLLPEGFDQPAPTPAPAPAPAPVRAPARPAAPTTIPQVAESEAQGDRLGEVSADVLDDVSDDELAESGGEGDAPVTAFIRSSGDFGDAPWGVARARFITALARDLDTPLVSRWGHIGLRNAMLAPGAAPRGLSEADWIAERAWLLLRMGEADAARLLIAGVPKGRYSPRLSQVALQTALATSDMAAMCPLPPKLDKAEPTAEPLVAAICAALSGQPEVASDAINRERRRGKVGGIDLALAEKLVGAGSATARAVTLEWQPVSSLTTWRYGLATATGVELPQALIDAAPLRMRAWQARAPLTGLDRRLAPARQATGLGVFSGQALTDLYSLYYDSGDSDAVAKSEAVTLRRAFVAADVEDRLSAMRAIWDNDRNDTVQRRASRALVGRAAARLVPSADLEGDAAELIASMLAVGMDESAARWASILKQIDEDDADPSWAQLVLASADPRAVDLTRDRIDDFGSRDESENKWRAKHVIAGLGALGRIDRGDLSVLDEKYGLGLSRQTAFTRAISGAARRGEAGTVMLLVAVAMQGEPGHHTSALHFYHIVRALEATGHDYLARMIAAEALAPA